VGVGVVHQRQCGATGVHRGQCGHVRMSPSGGGGGGASETVRCHWCPPWAVWSCPHEPERWGWVWCRVLLRVGSLRHTRSRVLAGGGVLGPLQQWSCSPPPPLLPLLHATPGGVRPEHQVHN
jgi:hypothetical protein